MTNGHASLCVVGSGISAPAQTTVEAIAHIEAADAVLMLIPDPFTEYWVRSLNAAAESLVGLYAEGKQRKQTYIDIADYILARVRDGGAVCVVTYGHPGVYATPFHRAVTRAREEGFAATMLPGISADACLFADCGIDPSEAGSQSYEATDFLLRTRALDTSVSLILWQIGVIGEFGFRMRTDNWNPAGLRMLLERLMQFYPPDHAVIVYEAARYPGIPAKIVRVAIDKIESAAINPMSTLYVPPATAARIDREMARRLHIDIPGVGAG